MPVPAGISLPMMMFSLRPTRLSPRPSIAASVSTRVVSWNEAADSHESVASDALVTVHLLDLFDQVHLRLAHALDLHELLRVEGALGEGIAGAHLLAVGDDQAALAGQRDRLFRALVGDHGDRDALALVLVDA